MITVLTEGTSVRGAFKDIGVALGVERIREISMNSNRKTINILFILKMFFARLTLVLFEDKIDILSIYLQMKLLFLLLLLLFFNLFPLPFLLFFLLYLSLLPHLQLLPIHRPIVINQLLLDIKLYFPQFFRPQ